MKLKKFLVITLLLICSFSLTIPAYAATNASDQISAYSISAIPVSNSRIAIEFSVTGAYLMSKLGAKNIAIYNYSGQSWNYVGGYTQNDSGMTRSNAFVYGNTIYLVESLGNIIESILRYSQRTAPEHGIPGQILSMLPHCRGNKFHQN